VIMQLGEGEPITEGKGKLDDCGVVFDAEALGAWRGLERGLQEAIPGTKVTVCLDNTGVIWCLRGTASETSQWAFLAFQKAADTGHGTVNVKWSPGHMGIEPNEIADRLATLGTKASRDPDTRPTLAGVRSQVRKRLRGLRTNIWRAMEDKMSRRYKSWDLPYDTRRHPEELEVLTRSQLQRFLAIRTGHCDRLVPPEVQAWRRGTSLRLRPPTNSGSYCHVPANKEAIRQVALARSGTSDTTSDEGGEKGISEVPHG